MICLTSNDISDQQTCPLSTNAAIVSGNKTRQGSVRKRFLKPAGYLFLGCAK